jgi:hypothetical protein
MGGGKRSVHYGLNVIYARQVESSAEAALRRGYLASAQVVAESDRRRRRLAAPSLGVSAGALLAWAMAVGVVAAGALTVLAAILVVVWLSPSAARQAALDRMVELEPFAVAEMPGSVRRAVARRSQKLCSERYRQRLAGCVMRVASMQPSPAPLASPGAAALAREPELARQIAARLLTDERDPQLAVAVGRLLTAGGRPVELVYRVRQLLATA